MAADAMHRMTIELAAEIKQRDRGATNTNVPGTVDELSDSIAATGLLATSLFARMRAEIGPLED